jgi:hypothetical protein
MAGYAAVLAQFQNQRQGFFRKQTVFSSQMLASGYDRLELALRLEKTDKVVLDQNLL